MKTTGSKSKSTATEGTDTVPLVPKHDIAHCMDAPDFESWWRWFVSCASCREEYQKLMYHSYTRETYKAAFNAGYNLARSESTQG